MHTVPAANGQQEVPVSLQILGQFELTIMGQGVPALNDRPSRLRSLLCYLILHRDRAVTHRELIEAFYSDENQRDPEGALKMQIMRLRGVLYPLLKEDTPPIISSRGTYQWSSALPCRVDAERFEALCSEAEAPGVSDDRRLSIYREALPLYRGVLELEKNDSLWCHTCSTHYFSRYLAAVPLCATLLLADGQAAEAEALCLSAISMDALNESLYIPAIQAMLQQNKYAEARRTYIHLSELLHRELGVRPSEELQKLYTQSMKEGSPGEQDLNTVMSALRAGGEGCGAFFCGIEQFKSIYQLELRRIHRSGECLHIIMLTVAGADGESLPARVAGSLMPTVQDSVVGSLRQSDVVAQYSASQFIILLPGANYENSVMVSRRIMDAYQVKHPQSAARLSCQIREPELL